MSEPVTAVELSIEAKEGESEGAVVALLEWDLGDVPDEAKEYPVLLTTAYY